jgi:hypothetical protein
MWKSRWRLSVIEAGRVIDANDPKALKGLEDEFSK